MDNLKSYLRECALPRLPIDGNLSEPLLIGHKSHRNHLAVRPETWRRLETICPLSGTIDHMVTSWADATKSEEPIILSNTEGFKIQDNFTIPSPSMPNNSFRMLKSPGNILRLASWLDNLPLQTVENIVHLLHPHTQPWAFDESDEERLDQRDKDIFRCFTWSRGATRTLRAHALVVAYQPPWILTHQDIKEFADCRSFPPFRKMGNAFPIPLRSRERLWAKLWDTCVEHQTHWFVLTSYDNWVFGTFSTGFTTAFVTDVYTYDASNPTIAEFLTFWTLSAMGIAGCAIPKVPEPVTHHTVPAPMPKSSTDIPNPANSESNWDSKSDEIASSAGVWSNLSSKGSTYTGLPGPIAPIHQVHGLPSTLIVKWLADAGVNALRADAPEIVPADSGSLVQIPYSRHVGDWLV